MPVYIVLLFEIHIDSTQMNLILPNKPFGSTSNIHSCFDMTCTALKLPLELPVFYLELRNVISCILFLVLLLGSENNQKVETTPTLDSFSLKQDAR